jgi:hypothetical protein
MEQQIFVIENARQIRKGLMGSGCDLHQRVVGPVPTHKKEYIL